MPASLTIRNLTSIPLTICVVEQFEALGSKNSTDKKGRDGVDHRARGLTGNLTSLMKDVIPNGRKRRQDFEILPSQKSSGKEDVNIDLKPFRTKKTQLLIRPAYILRLTFRDEDGRRWNLNVPTPSGESTALKAILTGVGEELAAIYNDRSSVLAIFESTNMDKWMEDFPDHTPLSALSIPGTHNTPTCYQALPSVRCQAVSPLTQMQNGVRFFDVRVQVNEVNKGADSDAMELVHAVFPISLTGSVKARSLFNEMYGFLEKHPSETIILSLKREGRGSGTDAIFSERLRKQYIKPRAERWHTKSGVPILGDVRGKIVLLRRFCLSDRMEAEVHGRGGFGIDATNWADNTPNHHGGDIQIQDFYEVTHTENIDKKIKLVCDHFERAGAAVHPIGIPKTAVEGLKQPLFINFLSAANFWKLGCWPDKIAAKMNPAITRFLCERHDIGDNGVDAPGHAVTGDGALGVVVCDWVGENGDWDLVRAIVGMNSRLLLRFQQQEESDGDSGTGEGGQTSTRNGRGRGGRGRRGP